MAFDADATFIAARGAVLVADVATAAIEDYETVDLNGAPPLNWTNLGHFSADNPIAFAKNGGEVTTKASWWTAQLRSTKAPTDWSVTLNALQIDKEIMELAFGGGVLDTVKGSFTVTDSNSLTNKAVMIIMVDGPIRAAFYFSNASFSIGDAFSLAIDNFLEIQLTANILVDGSGNRFTIYHPALKAA
jgi:hypothetical protein